MELLYIRAVVKRVDLILLLLTEHAGICTVILTFRKQCEMSLIKWAVAVTAPLLKHTMEQNGRYTELNDGGARRTL